MRDIIFCRDTAFIPASPTPNNMDEDEAALLAELRAISNGSAAASRFGQDENEHDDDSGGGA